MASVTTELFSSTEENSSVVINWNTLVLGALSLTISVGAAASAPMYIMLTLGDVDYFGMYDQGTITTLAFPSALSVTTPTTPLGGQGMAFTGLSNLSCIFSALPIDQPAGTSTMSTIFG